MTWPDAVPIALTLLLVVGCTWYSRRYVRGVADFVAGGRAAGRYLICNAKGESGSGVANTMARFQVVLVSGFVLGWWEAVSMPVLLLVGISGFVAYRYRQTRAMTLGQFFEMRYSRRFRLFAGGLGFVAGLLNYGIFPAVGSNFFVFFLGLPTETTIVGITVPTYAVIMAAYLTATLVLMAAGGQVALMLADSIGGILSHALYVALVFAVFALVSWPQARETMLNTPPHQSLVNPFDASAVNDFNALYAAMTLLLNVYMTMAWQSGHNFNSAARSPHELRMGNVLGYWRVYARQVMIIVLGVAAMTFLRHSDFAAASGPAREAIDGIADPQLRTQMTVPVALRYFLPWWAKALFATVMWMGLVAGDASHLLSWASIFVQDIVLPLRRTPLTPTQHVRWLRLAVAGVAAFAFVFSLSYRQTQHIYLWWAVTTAVFAGGAGAVIVGGLYWRRGTTAAAWTALLLGSVLAIGGIVARQYVPGFPMNGTQVSFVAAIASSLAYVGVSLAERRRFDLDALLHRDPSTKDKKRPNLFDFDADFTPVDRVVSGGILVWSALWLLVVLGGCVWNYARPWPAGVWADYWLVVGVLLPLLVAVVTLFWFGVGGVKDLVHVFARLASSRRDVHDDGSVATDPKTLTPFAAKSLESRVSIESRTK